MFDVSKIKSDFPIFKRKFNGKPIVYLDSTASSLKPQKVIDSVNEYYTKYSVNIFRGVYTISEEATEKYEEARVKVAAFIGAKNPNEIVFVRNATEAINLVMSTWGRSNIEAKDEIISTVMEHHANIVTWQELAKEKGATLKFLDFDRDGYLDLAQLPKLITRKTKLLALTSVSNVLGTINPVKDIIKTAKKINPEIKVLVDGAQAIPHMPVDVENLGCDFFAFSGHKMLGPTGIGVLWGKYELLEAMPPYQFGGEMIQTVYLAKTTFKNPPYKFEAGTPHIAGVMGLGAAIDYLSALGMEDIRLHEKELVAYGLKRLEELNGVTVYGPKDSGKKGGVIAFTVFGIHPHDVAQVLNDDNICIRSGHHCAMPLHIRMNLTATCRASLYVYNTKEDIDALITGLHKTQKLFNPHG